MEMGKGNYQKVENEKLIVEAYNKIISGDEMQPSHLDQFDLSKFNLPKVSAIVTTYNRSPHTVKEDANPLGWCLESLLAQKQSGLGEIVVVNDCSKDYTKDVVQSFQEKSPIPINYLENDCNLGFAKSRNIGVRESKHDFVFFLDDDCVFSNYFVFGANYTLNNLEKDVAAVHMPVYHRKMKPSLMNVNQIGLLDFPSGIITGNYEAFPEEYVEDIENNLMDSHLKIVKPIEIKNLGGIFLSKKQVFLDVNGFPENFSWKNGYGVETDFALRLSEKGHRMFFTPDPKFHSIHLKYGSFGKEAVSVEDPKLKRLISHSVSPTKDTGCRVDSEEWFFDRIISSFVLIGLRNPKVAENYSRHMRELFVDKNELSMAGVGTKIEDLSKRKDIFQRAISEGYKFIEESA